ncbi:MAG: hypothetical protein H7246_13610 [Phycisphaerae bacterium]|nr:hypothetical protein [Saprospiraceae bacterium]
MPLLSKKGISLFAAIALLTIAVAIIPEIIGEDMKTWCAQTLGPHYRYWLFGAFVISAAMLVYLTTDFGKSEKNAEQAPLTPSELETYRTGIREWLKSRYLLRLDQKMAGRLPINLSRLASTEGTSEFRAETFEEISDEKIQGKLTELFREAKGRLLILGAPGAGKTTLMLQLALGLIDSEIEAIPVVVNLATWSSEFKTFEDWLIKILPIELGANTALTTKMLTESPLILLFDGLDEIGSEMERAACLSAIGAFGAYARREYAISSRKKEYLTAAKDAPVRFQIEVGLLKIEQIEVELARRGHSQPEDRLLLNFLRNDQPAREAAETPFYFNCLQWLFSKSMTPADLNFLADSREGREKEILDRFVEFELKKCKKQATGRWLTFLASRMNKRNMVRFELRDLHYPWWKKWEKMELFFAGLIAGLVNASHLGLVFGLFIGLIRGMIEGAMLLWLLFGPLGGLLLFGLFFGLMTGLILLLDNNKTPRIVTVGSLMNYWLPWQSTRLWKFNLWESSFWESNLWKFILKRLKETDFGQFIGLVVMRLFGLIKGFLSFLHFIWLLFVLLFWLCCGRPVLDSLKTATPYQHFITSMKLLHFSILQHLLLRYQLSKKGLLPLRLVDFLNEMASYQSEKEKQQGKPKPRRFTTADVHLLESDGATWRFRHRLIQEWFARNWKEE